MITVEHAPSCRADYPEKVPGETPQQIHIDEDEDTIVHICVECGAFTTVILL